VTVILPSETISRPGVYNLLLQRINYLLMGFNVHSCKQTLFLSLRKSVDYLNKGKL
jgi:hypothetical protein